MGEPVVSAFYSEGIVPPSATPSNSAVSWPAIFAGAVVASAVTLILLALGSGLGFASLSPWPSAGVSGITFAMTAAIWLIVTQWISAGLGGYIAGRLRSRWIGTHTHEVFFRDTAHGLITWGLASLLMAVILTTSAVSSLGTMGHAAADAASMGAKSAATIAPATGYEIDRLLRPSGGGAPTSAGADPKAEITHIIANSGTNGSVSDGDRSYLAQLVELRTGVGHEDAQKRVDDFVTSIADAEAKAKAAADSARKTAAQTSIYLALSLLVGAFIACVSAALGGRLRDEHP